MESLKLSVCAALDLCLPRIKDYRCEPDPSSVLKEEDTFYVKIGMDEGILLLLLFGTRV
jgi:hypothetical protein